MEEPWTLVVIAVCACFMVCALLFTIIRCCLCSYKGMKTYKDESKRYVIPFDYRPQVAIDINDETYSKVASSTIASDSSSIWFCFVLISESS